MRTEKRDVFVADDGRVFDTKDAAVAHEKQMAENARRIGGLKVFIVTSGFDGNEGRGYHWTTYIITDASMAVVLEFCLDHFGRPLSGWYGNGYYEAWIIRQADITATEALQRVKAPHPGIGLSRGEAKLVFISARDIDHPGLPPRVFPWPKSGKKA